MPGRSRPRLEPNPTPSGLTARWVIGPRPGSPPRVRLPHRPRRRLQPRTLVALANLFLSAHNPWYRKSNPVKRLRLFNMRNRRW
jgi:hypothetical protein